MFVSTCLLYDPKTRIATRKLLCYCPLLKAQGITSMVILVQNSPKSVWNQGLCYFGSLHNREITWPAFIKRMSINQFTSLLSTAQQYTSSYFVYATLYGVFCALFQFCLFLTSEFWWVKSRFSLILFCFPFKG